MSIIAELKRRNVFRVGIAYLVLGWVVIQVTDTVAPALGLPEWTLAMVTWLGVIGLPFALLFAWAFELTPDGLKRSADVHPDDSIVHETGARLNRVMIGLMALVIVALLADRFLTFQLEQPFDQSPASAGAGAVAPVTAGPAGEAEQGRAKSIAVLPFVNMSNDPDQEYFSDGISEELLNALAKIRELRVAARTSSFAFKGRDQNITQIGDQLKVETVLEGSVRKSGKRLRITAQLISVEDGYHLWSETYDRDITDVFVIQDEISAAIVKALRIHLAGGESVGESGVVDVEAYNFYLLARHNLRRRTAPSLTLAVKQFQQAIDIDPGYAAAWAGKALATNLLSDSNYGKVPKLEAVQQAQMMLDMAFSLDANLGAAHAVQALLLEATYRPEESLASLERAISANPSEGVLYSWQANALSDIGQFDQAFKALKTAYEVDPLHPVIRINLARYYVAMHEDTAARALLTPGTSMTYELEAEIADRDGQPAAVIAAYKKALELAEDGWDARSQFILSLTYFFDLKNTELAGKNVPDRWKLFYQSILEPVKALSRLRQLPDVGDRNSSLWPLVYALIQLEHYEEALIALEPKKFGERPLHGNMRIGSSDIWLAYMQAYCQQRLAKVQDAQAMAGRIQQFIAVAVANGEPPNYFHLLAAVQLLMGKDDEAMQSLTQAWENYALDWTDLSSPWYLALHQREEFQALKESMQTHLNGERAKLGWDPVEI